MSGIEKIKKTVEKHREILKKEYKIKRLSVFGSFARGEQKKNSDIDMLVEFSGPVGFGFFSASDYLEQILERKVDLVTKDAIRPELKRNIYRDLVDV